MDVVLNGDRRGMQGPLQSVCSPPVSSNLMCLAHGSIPLDCKHKGPSSLLDVLNPNFVGRRLSGNASQVPWNCVGSLEWLHVR